MTQRIDIFKAADHAVQIVHTDYVAHVAVLTHLAQLLRAQGSGTLVVFSSVAGVRVRRANYVYGSAKAGLDGFASGLADALAGSGVRLLLVRPGFVVCTETVGMSIFGKRSTPSVKKENPPMTVRIRMLCRMITNSRGTSVSIWSAGR